MQRSANNRLAQLFAASRTNSATASAPAHPGFGAVGDVGIDHLASSFVFRGQVGQFFQRFGGAVAPYA